MNHTIAWGQPGKNSACRFFAKGYTPSLFVLLFLRKVRDCLQSSGDVSKCRFIFRGVSDRGGLKVDVSVRQPEEDDPKRIEASSADHELDYRKWNKVAVRLQEGERVIRIYIKDMVNPAKVDMLSGIAAFPKNAQLRLAQELSKGRENQITIIDKFKVKCPKRRKFFQAKRRK